MEQQGKKELIIKSFDSEGVLGYKQITTFFEDFSIADNYGIEAIKDTYKRGFATAKALGYKYLTEFVMVLNWKAWEHNESDQEKSELYIKLYEEADKYAIENLKGEELSYFYTTTD
jgi:predicted negative regulator of RcsB-dependent stress response